MKKLTSNEIRKIWLDFFKKNNHFEVESASLIPINDNSLLWINSGVATLKKYFSGKENPPHPNLTNSQKCIRTNDIFNVGVTSRHQTFFEMLGNFSIGGYFKEKAIELAFELLIKEFKVDLEKLYFTVFNEDTITYNKWISLGVNKKHIIKCGRDRNFWDVGNGPCGPCTEIYYDRGEKYDPNNEGEKLFLNDIENDRYVEIWNIVFSEFNNDGNNNYKPLDRKNIDTGAGLERIVSISQDVPTNFDTDLFQNTIKKIEEFSDLKYSMNAYFEKKNEKQQKINLAYKIISDHARASIFAIADGAIPSNKDRGYVLRRLIRRMIVMLQKINIEKNIFSSIVDSVIETMGSYYSYLKTQRKKIVDVLTKEYEIFKKTLDQGFKLYRDAVSNNKLSPEVVFKLVETYGFPIELIKELASDDKLEIDENKFNELFKKHQEISRTKQNNVAMQAQNGELLNLKTDFKFYYDKNQMEAKIVKLYDDNFNPINKLDGSGYVVLDKSCCYATSGGQLHDIGFINSEYEIDNVIKGPNLQHIHHIVDANLSINEKVIISHDVERRSLLAKNHSVEHLIHATLGKLIDKNIKQEGAFKSPEKVTFDFQYHEKLSSKQLRDIENEINNIIKESVKVDVLNLTLEEAQKLGAKAYFEDVYKKIKGTLRVIRMGDKSIELCGGTHVSNTNEIEIFKITNLTSKAAGSWRIEAITSNHTYSKYVNDIKNNINEELNKYLEHSWINDGLKKQIKKIDLKNKDIDELIAQFNKTKLLFNEAKMEHDKKESKKQILEVKSKLLLSKDKLIIIETKNIDNKNVFNALTEVINENQLSIFVVFNEIDEKIQYMLATNQKNNQFNLNNEIKLLNNEFNGKGGGKPNFVQGGCLLSEFNLSKASKLIKESLKI